MRTRRLILIVVIFIALAAVVCVGGGQLAANLVEQSRQPAATPEGASTAARLRAQGQVVPVHWVELGFPAGGPSGWLAEVPVEAGQAVQAGEVLARLDPTRLALAVRAAQDAVAAQEASLGRLQEPPNPADVAAAEADLEAAQAALEALQAGPSPADMAAAEAEVAAAQAELARLKALPDPEALAQAQAQLDKAALALQQAQAAYDRIRDRPDAGMMSQAVALQQATIDYHVAETTFDMANGKATPSALKSAEARLAAAQASLARAKEGPSEADLAAARSRIRNAEAALARAQEGAGDADIAAAEASLAQARTQLDQAQADLEAATLRAPFAGTVVAVEADPGEVVGATPFITLADLSAWQVETVDVDEWMVARLKTGQAVELSFPAFDQKVLTGVVDSIALRAEQGSGTDSFYSYTLIITLDEGDPELRWGMSARLDFGEEP